MEKIYLKTLLVAAGLASAVQLMAVDVPFAKEPVDGKTYILVSRSNPQRFWNRTGWDGAVYLQPFSNFNPAFKTSSLSLLIEAHDNYCSSITLHVTGMFDELFFALFQ